MLSFPSIYRLCNVDEGRNKLIYNNCIVVEDVIIVTCLRMNKCFYLLLLNILKFINFIQTIFVQRK